MTEKSHQACAIEFLFYATTEALFGFPDSAFAMIMEKVEAKYMLLYAPILMKTINLFYRDLISNNKFRIMRKNINCSIKKGMEDT